MMAERMFRDRRDAGRVLAGLLEGYRGRSDVVVLGLPRGGVPAAYEVATALDAPFDVFLVRKLGVPGHEELAMGAIASGGVVVLNEDVVRGLGIPPEVIGRVAEQEAVELRRREQASREGRPAPEIEGKVVIIVDDGLATGASMRAAVQALRQRKPARIVVAVPAAPESTCRELAAIVEEVVCASTPSPFFAVGASYWDFRQTTNEEVREFLRTAATWAGMEKQPAESQPGPADQSGAGGERTADDGPNGTPRKTRVTQAGVRIPVAGVVIEGDLAVPEAARGLVLFAHGSGSSRHSPRNRHVAAELRGAGLATALVDLLTPIEEQIDARTGQLRFDISMLAVRVAALTDWLTQYRQTAGLRIGLFGASTGAAAALVATAARPAEVKAVVSRGGRPDLAGEFLHLVRQPTLLIVGERDEAVIGLNRAAMEKLPGETRLEIVPGASHLFEEAGTMEQVARLARDWFTHYLAV
jgi:putative phosphoribosyl transferase